MRASEDRNSRLHDLNQVLIEYGVFTDSMEDRRRLLGPLIEAGTTDSELRECCEYTRQVNERVNNIGEKIARMIRNDPRLRATLVASRKRRSWIRRQAEARPNEDGMEQNMERERHHPAAAEQRLAMRAFCSLTYREVPDLATLAKQLGVDERRADELVKIGADLYGGKP